MPQKSIKGVQVLIIKEMDELCSPLNNVKFSIRRAALKVSGERNEFGESDERQSERALMKVSARTVERYYKLWIDFRILPCQEKKKKPKKKAILLWNSNDDKVLKAVVDKCPVLYLDEISKILKTKLKKKFTTQEISKRLRGPLGYSRKVVYEKASQQVATDKSQFLEALEFYVKHPEMAIFVDESNKDRKAARRKYGWSAVGTPVNYRELFNMDVRYTLIGVADCFGFVIPACTVVPHQYKEKEEQKPVDADRFVEFVRDELVPHLGNYERREAHSVVIMDNCSIHIDARVKELIEGAGAVLLYSAPYCPEVIPIEYMFHSWKAYLKRYSVDFNQEWYEVHLAALASISPQQGLNFFKTTTLVDMVQEHPLSEECQAEEWDDIEKLTLLCYDELFP
jgi:hypothetical protein